MFRRPRRLPGFTQVPDPLNNGLTNDGAVRVRSTLQAIAAPKAACCWQSGGGATRQCRINLTNSPQFGSPNADINSLSFGRITSDDGLESAREFLKARGGSAKSVELRGDR